MDAECLAGVSMHRRRLRWWWRIEIHDPDLGHLTYEGAKFRRAAACRSLVEGIDTAIEIVSGP